MKNQRNGKNNKMTTIAIFTSDLKLLDKIIKEDEEYRDKIHELLLKEKKKKMKSRKIIMILLIVIYLAVGSFFLSELNESCLKVFIAIGYLVGCAIIGYNWGKVE